jgi:hypothetical protein
MIDGPIGERRRAAALPHARISRPRFDQGKMRLNLHDDFGPPRTHDDHAVRKDIDRRAVLHNQSHQLKAAWIESRRIKTRSIFRSSMGGISMWAICYCCVT